MYIQWICGRDECRNAAVLFDVAGAYRELEFPRVESLAGLERWLKQ